MIKAVILALVAGIASMEFGVWLSALFSAVAAASIFASLFYYKRIDGWDRFLLAGMAGSIGLSFPALFWNAPELDGWSFGVSKFFFMGLVFKRFGLPVIYAIITQKRIKDGAPWPSNEEIRRFTYRDTR